MSYMPLGERLSSWGAAALRCLPPEAAHDIGLRLLSSRMFSHLPRPQMESYLPGLQCVVPGLGTLSHPVGLAAGFDKDCRCPEAFGQLGFSFVELGTVTPEPQPGNPKPRIFRQKDQLALINRLGFNSAGAATVAHRLRQGALGVARFDGSNLALPIGVNCGKNRHTPLDRATDDYTQVIQTFGDLPAYFTVNVSSPNTPGLRELATPKFLHYLADQIGSWVSKTWIKVDPDMARDEFQALIETIQDRGYQGVILCNTHRVNWPEQGGQSGHPLTGLCNARLEWAWEVHRGHLPMIAVGGIMCGLDILEKVSRGAVAVQIYTALVYRGPWVVAKLLEELGRELQLRSYTCLADATGSYYVS